MSVFGGMSKGERNRIKVRVHSAMASQVLMEGRYLGGRPPYGYRLSDLGPHSNPGKAADGKRLHGLEPDPDTAPVVARIFTKFLSGHGIFAIAEGLTRDGIPSPSAHDRARNPHRDTRAWAKSAVQRPCSCRTGSTTRSTSWRRPQRHPNQSPPLSRPPVRSRRLRCQAGHPPSRPRSRRRPYPRHTVDRRDTNPSGQGRSRTPYGIEGAGHENVPR
ncbi:recombinase family protein [Streptomyces sp. S465]|uniref:recombinase family protein n=1 Tax=Streptomyces sp. S465 TaxID=2979468 RepID=UPI003FCC7989